MQLDICQEEAIAAGTDLKRRVVAVSGAAGTGKTTIIKRICDDLVVREIPFAIAAPTGKAAKRITEATGYSACTIHRLLEYPHPGERCPKTGKALRTTEPKRGRQNPIGADVVIIDEYMMVNKELHRNLMDAIRPGGCIRVFGDVKQLPPIESDKRLWDLPSAFEDLLERFQGITLKTIHRQTEGSSIIENGARINNKQIPRRYDDFVLRITDDPVTNLRKFIIDAKKAGVDFTDVTNQVITPTKKGWTGSTKLSNLMQMVLQPDTGRCIQPERHSWDDNPELHFFVGDKVICMTNMYDLEVFNGETGIIKTIHDDGAFTVDFGDKAITIPPILQYIDAHGNTRTYNPQKEIDLAYAITTHKAQGSEYAHVCYVLNKSSKFVQNRANIYTAITRARKTVSIISDQESLSFSVWKDYTGVRKK